MNTPLADRLQRVLRADVQAMHAYAVQPSAGLIKLDVMENPYRLPEPLQLALGARLAGVALNRYPAERTLDLQAALARHARLPEGCALMLGNGSDELITLLTLAVSTHLAGGAPPPTVLAPQPSFVMYQIAAAQFGAAFVGVPTTADFELDLPALQAAIAQHQPALIWLACPNNPTANLWDAACIEAVIAAAPGLVVIDEAYQPFAGRDARAQLQAQEHVLILRTLSKFGLAGVRIGYLMGRAPLIAELDKLRPPFNVGVLNAEAALFALEHEAVYAEQAAAIRAERARLLATLPTLGVQAYPSEANMVLVRVADAAATHAALKARGVLVKNVSALHPLLANCLRLTVGSPEENDALIAALKDSP